MLTQIKYALLLLRLYCHALYYIIDQSVHATLENLWQFFQEQTGAGRPDDTGVTKHVASPPSDAAPEAHNPAVAPDETSRCRTASPGSRVAALQVAATGRGLAGVCIVTGGCSGIGLATVRQLLQRGMTVVVGGHARDLNILQELEQQGCCGRVVGLPLDLASLASVKQFAKTFTGLHLPLHILINNGGVMFSPARCSPDGFEVHWAVNFLSHVLLTHLLLPAMKDDAAHSAAREVYKWSGAPHIVNVSSSTHALASPTAVGGPHALYAHTRPDYFVEEAYFNSKLALVYASAVLRERLGRRVRVSCLHPGVVNTGLYQHVYWDAIAGPLKRGLLMSADKSAEHVLLVALSRPSNQEPALYYNTNRPGYSLPPSDPHAAALWANTARLLADHVTLL